MKEHLHLSAVFAVVFLVCEMIVLGVTSSIAQETVYVTNFGSDFVSLIDVHSNKRVADIQTGKKPHGVAVTPDGRKVYVTNEGDNTATVIDAVARRSRTL